MFFCADRCTPQKRLLKVANDAAIFQSANDAASDVILKFGPKKPKCNLFRFSFV